MAEELGSKSIWDTRPQFSNPSMPVFPTPVRGGTGACGSYWDSVEIRQPYKNIDKYVEILPMLVASKREDRDASIVTEKARIVRSWVFTGGLTHDAIATAESMYEKYKGIIDKKNKNAIKGHIDLAWKYAKDAKALWDWWADKYVSVRTPLFIEHNITVSEDSEWLKKNFAAFQFKFVAFFKKHKDKKVPLATANYKIHWPLSELEYAGCDKYYLYPNLGVVKVGVNFDEVFVQCPEGYEFDAHTHDAQLYCDLAIASVAHARCAAEAAAAVGIFYKNKAAVSGRILPTQGPTLRDDASGWILATKKPSISDVGDSLYAPPSEPDEDAPIVEVPVGEDGGAIPDIGVEGPEDEDVDGGSDTMPVSPKKTAKKKDNTMLIVGAAAVGLLMVMKK